VLTNLTRQLAARQSLNPEEVKAAVAALIGESPPVAAKAEFLAALAQKGETPEEIAAFAGELGALSVLPPLDEATRAGEILDVCGTGGDHLGTFNISTTVAIVCAAAGVKVAKHGNRAITSKAGSADVLEALGIRIDLSPTDAAAALREHNFAFFFAPNYHPAFKHIAPARKRCAERGQRTIFNFLGPLLNPARPTAQLLGVPRRELCEPLARVLQSLGVRRGMVVCGDIPPLRTLPSFNFDPTNRVQTVRVIDLEGKSPPPMSVLDALEMAGQNKAVLVSVLPDKDPPVYRMIDSEIVKRLGLDVPEKHLSIDELFTLGLNTVAEFYQERGFTVSTLDSGQFPVQPATLQDLLGDDREANARIVRRVLHGQDRGPKRDVVLLNAGAGLFVAGRVRSISEGWGLAAEVIDSGAAAAKLAALATHAKA